VIAWLACGAAAVAGCGGESPRASEGPAVARPVHAGDAGGSRYSTLAEITPANVDRLEVAWEYHTGDLRDDAMQGRNHAFQATPILVGDTLFFCTPRSRIVALEAETGRERCNAPPWGAIAALDLGARARRWEVTLGTVRDLSPVPIPIPWSVPNMGGPIATAGGVVFVGAALDDYLRTFDSETGREIWKGRLPAGGHATPMTYRVREGGRQLVVIAAGGHAQMRSSPGDSLVAFALPR